MISAAAIAGRLLELEPAGAPAVLEKLAAYLARIVGTDGIRALYERSLRQVGAAHPWLAGAAVARTQPPWPALSTCLAQHSDRAGAAERDLVAGFIALFANFVGEDLTRRFLHELWPGVAVVTPPKETK